MALLETVLASRFIREVLADDLSLDTLLGGTHIYARKAPPDALDRYIVFQQQASLSSLVGIGSERTSQKLDYRVKVTGKNASAVDLEEICNRVIELLHGRSYHPVTGGMIYSSVYEDVLELEGVQGDVTYLQEILRFTIDVKAS